MSDQSTDPIRLLLEAAVLAEERGVEVSGFNIQGSGEGYAAWLYAEDEDGQWPLFEEVDIHATALEAAQWVMEMVRSAEVIEE